MKIESYFKKSPIFKILNQASELEDEINFAIRDSMLSYYQALILIALYSEQDNDISLKDLVPVFPITKSACSQIVSLLESRKLISRKIAKDKRSYMFKITLSGASTAIKLIGQLEKIEQKYEHAISSQKN